MTDEQLQRMKTLADRLEHADLGREFPAHETDWTGSKEDQDDHARALAEAHARLRALFP